MPKKTTRATPILAPNSQETTGEETATLPSQDRQVEIESHTMATQHSLISPDITSNPTIDPPLNAEEELDLRIRAMQKGQRLRRKRQWIAMIEAGEELDFDPLDERAATPRLDPSRHDYEDDDQRPSNVGYGRVQMPTPRYSGKSHAELQDYFSDQCILHVL